ncbi:MAG: hypothetical protein V5A50_13950 [Thiohalorhabdus sp.]|uniref:hypothetical protein n=1 Tax=Thiohalorhabdus sp. TaxID=3094134 RepID=UPI002FC3AD5A
MREDIKAGSRLGGQARAPIGLADNTVVHGHWHLLAWDENGHLVREDAWDNLVVDEGLNHILSVVLAGGTQITSWYIGLTDGSPTTAAGDTMGSHSGWTEVTAYSETNRQDWVAGSVGSQSVDNSGSKASYSIDTDSKTIGGAFLVSDNTKGGTSGTLYSVGAFSGGDLTLNSGSTLDVTATFTTS